MPRKRMKELTRAHNGRFDYTSGKALGAPVLVDLRPYPVRLENATVYVDVA